MMVQTVEVQATRAKRLLSIQDALIWAFRDECASLDFNEVGTLTGVHRGFGMEYVMIEQARLGCRVDGGGRSEPHSDADVIASAVAALPDAQGGRPMAARIAGLAAAGGAPMWGQGITPQVVPVSTTRNQNGVWGKSVAAHEYDPDGWQPVKRINRKGRAVVDVAMCTPVTIRPSQSAFAAWRREYLDWWGVLLELRSTFKIYDNLTSIMITDQMPEMEPWKKNG